MTIRNMDVKTASHTNPAASEYPPGECAPYPLAANPPARVKSARPLAMKNSTAPPATPPRTCAAAYGNKRVAGNRPPAHNPIETAGLKWPPEIGPSAYAPVNTV